MTSTRKGRKDIENSGYYRALASSDNDEISSKYLFNSFNL